MGGGRGPYCSEPVSPISCPLSPFFSHSWALFCAFLHSRKTQPFYFQAIPHSSRKTPGVGGRVPLSNQPLSQRSQYLDGRTTSSSVSLNSALSGVDACPDRVGVLVPLLSFDFQFSTVNFQPSHPPCGPLRLIEREGKEKQLLVALDLQSDRRSRWQSLQRTTQPIQRRHRLAIQRTNHVAGVQRHFHASARRASGNDNPKRVAQVRRQRGDLLVNFHAKNPQRRHKVFLRVGQRGDLIHIAWRLHHRDIESEPALSAQYVEMDFVSRLQQIEMKCHQRQIVGCPPVDGGQYVSDLHPCRFGRAARQNVGDDHPVRSREAQCRRHAWRNRLDSDSNFSAVQVTELPQLPKSDVHHIARDRESQSFVSTRLRQNESIHSHHFSIHIHKGTARIPGIDRRIRLDVHHRRIRFRLARYRRNYSHRDRIAKSSRTPEGKNDLPLAQFSVRTQRQRGKFFCFNFQDREIDLAGHSNNAGGKNCRSSRQRRSHRPIGICGRQHHLDPLRSLHHVRVRHNVPAGIDHKSRADRPLPANHRARVSVLTFFKWSIPRYQDLYHAGRDFFNKGIYGFVELSQCIGGMILGLPVCGRQMDKQK